MNNVFDKLYEYGIIPVSTVNLLSRAVPTARALAEGGLPVAEITFRTTLAAKAIDAIASELPDFLIGAGTVLTPEQAHEAIAAGAKFVVSPGTNPAVVEYCLSREVPVIPGCATPTEIETALHYGLEVVKFFPAERLGGSIFCARSRSLTARLSSCRPAASDLQTSPPTPPMSECSRSAGASSRRPSLLWRSGTTR